MSVILESNSSSYNSNTFQNNTIYYDTDNKVFIFNQLCGELSRSLYVSVKKAHEPDF